MNTLRSFIALPLLPELQQKMASIQSDLRESGADVKWDSLEKFHITLKFLGDTNSETTNLLTEQLKKAIGHIHSFDVVFEGVGGFPNIERPRVVWIGTRPNDDVQKLQKLVEQTCIPFGFSREDRQFHAHVTLGRVKGSRGLDRLTARLKSVTFGPSIARCTEITLMRSELKPTGSVYTLLHTIPLVS
jgi:2'-5' RNA ligase